MKFATIAISLVVGLGIATTFVNTEALAELRAFDIGRLIGGTIGWSLLVWIALSAFVAIFQKVPRHDLIWADRFAIGFLILGFFAFSYWLEGFQGGAILSAMVAVVAWVVFRTIDFMVGGSERRARSRQ